MVNIFHLNAAYTNNNNNGNKQTIVKVWKPAVINSYIASENKRKSNSTLPLFSYDMVLIRPDIDYFACEFSTAVNPICDIR